MIVAYISSHEMPAIGDEDSPAIDTRAALTDMRRGFQKVIADVDEDLGVMDGPNTVVKTA